LDTRETKKAVPPRSELLAQWQKTAAEYGFTPSRASRLCFKVRPQNTPEQAIRVADQAINSMAQRSTSFDRNRLLCEALYAAVEYGLQPALVCKAVDDRLRQRMDLDRIPGTDRNPRYTTPEVTSQRKGIGQSIDRLTSSKIRPATSREIDAVIAHYSKPRDPLTEELKHHVGQIARAAMREDTKAVNRDRIARQAAMTVSDKHTAAIRDIATNAARVKVLSTLSEDDHDLVLSACRRIWQKQGYAVIGTSLSKAATTRLEDETGIESMVLRKLELRMNPTTAFQVRYHARQLWRAARHRTTYALDRLKIDSKTVLVVDGADRLTFEQMAFLTRAVAKQGGQLVLVQGPGKRPHSPSQTPFDCVFDQLRQSKSDSKPTRDVPRERPNQSIDRQMWP
jgi:hypothetical protein